uniref:Uncharacterized protein n=1 Tax=Octopus bimaculoides TaxID=37653 RepID=A0A0L8GFY4_OCTBM
MESTCDTVVLSTPLLLSHSLSFQQHHLNYLVTAARTAENMGICKSNTIYSFTRKYNSLPCMLSNYFYTCLPVVVWL